MNTAPGHGPEPSGSRSARAVGHTSHDTRGAAACGPGGTPWADCVAFTPNGAVISAPYNRDQINGQETQISGGFTEASATRLARELHP